MANFIRLPVSVKVAVLLAKILFSSSILYHAIAQTGWSDFDGSVNDMMKRLSHDSMYEQDFRFTPEVEDFFIHHIFIGGGIKYMVAKSRVV